MYTKPFLMFLLLLGGWWGFGFFSFSSFFANNIKGKRKWLLTNNWSCECIAPADSHSWDVCLCCYGLGTIYKGSAHWGHIYAPSQIQILEEKLLNNTGSPNYL